jgi:hypothetical protein
MPLRQSWKIGTLSCTVRAYQPINLHGVRLHRYLTIHGSLVLTRAANGDTSGSHRKRQILETATLSADHGEFSFLHIANSIR